jgi:hypothetical protein
MGNSVGKRYFVANRVIYIVQLVDSLSKFNVRSKGR